MKRRLAAILSAAVVGCLALVTVPGPAGALEWAVEPLPEPKVLPPPRIALMEPLALAGPEATSVEAKVSLDEAIGIAKGAFPVPAGFTQFNSNYAVGEEEAFWHLHWSRKDPPWGSMDVTVNATTGEIRDVSFHLSPPPGTKYKGFPKYNREAAQTVAEKTARQLQPERFTQTRLRSEPVEEFRPLPGPGPRDYPVTYSFYFERLVEGIPVMGEGIHVGVNGETGEIQHFSVSWSKDLKLPPSAGRISEAQAREIFNSKGLELVYVYTGPHNRDSGERPYLVYRLRDGGFVLDALTGELIDPDGVYFGGMGEAGGMLFPSEMKDEMANLTPEEAAAVEETKGLLTVEAARQAAEAAWELPEGLKLKYSELTHNWAAPGNKVWNFSYVGEEERLDLGLGVDARTGELLHYRVYRMDRMDYFKVPEVIFSEDQARQVADTLIRRLQPEKAGEIVLRHTRRDYYFRPDEGEPMPRFYRFEYARQVQDIPYPANGFSVTVDAETGEVTSYHLNWWDTTFPEPAGVLSRDKVNAAFLAKSSLSLEYNRFYSKWHIGRQEPAYVLAYRLSTRTNVMVDALTGKELDWQGKPVVERAKGFKDIAGHPAEQDILLLAGAGIVTGYGEEFRPNKLINTAELITMLVVAYSDSHRYPLQAVPDGGPWYQPFLVRAQAMGILEEKDTVDPTVPITRLQAARLLVNGQGYGPLAKLASIFRLETSDAGSVPPTDVGYAAAAVGLGLLPLEDGAFRPAGGLTRGETARILVRALTVDG